MKITNTSNVLKQLSNTQKKIVLLLIAPFIVLEISIAVSRTRKGSKPMGEGVNCWQLEFRGAKALNSAISMDSSSFRACVSNIFDNDDC